MSLASCNTLSEPVNEGEVSTWVYQNYPDKPLVVISIHPPNEYTNEFQQAKNLQVLQVGDEVITHRSDSLPMPQHEGFGVGGERIITPKYYTPKQSYRIEYNNLLIRLVFDKGIGQDTIIDVSELGEDLDYRDGIINYQDLQILIASKDQYPLPTAVYSLPMDGYYLLVDSSSDAIMKLHLEDGTVSVVDDSEQQLDMGSQIKLANGSSESRQVPNTPKEFPSVQVRLVSGTVEVAVPATVSVSVHR